MASRDPLLGVIRLVASENTMMAIAKAQVNLSNKSLVFFTPMRLLAPDRFYIYHLMAGKLPTTNMLLLEYMFTTSIRKGTLLTT